jgi:pSer/pThr/pTyr-binding forkhead associated (FHA) protein
MIISRPRARAVKLSSSPQLVALSEGTNIPLDKPIVLIGRHQECDIQIPSRKISRRHCCIAMVADHLVVRDLGSTNGIRINGVKVVEGNLRPDDELTIGNMRYQVRWGGDAGHTAAASMKNGIKLKKSRPQDESCEVPMPLPDLALSHPALQGKPVQTGDAMPKLPSMEIPDSVNLRPLDPPQG